MDDARAYIADDPRKASKRKEIGTWSDRAPEIEVPVLDGSGQASWNGWPTEQDLIATLSQADSQIPDVSSDATVSGLVAKQNTCHPDRHTTVRCQVSSDGAPDPRQRKMVSRRSRVAPCAPCPRSPCL